MQLEDLKQCNDALLQLLQGEMERGGLILTDGTVVEIDNLCQDPTEGYLPNTEQLVASIDDAAATWHTRPGATANLSVEDWETFVNWPDHLHAIVGTDRVSR